MPAVSRLPTVWLSTLISLFLTLIGIPLELKIEQAVPGVPRWPALATLGLALAMLGILLVLRNHKDPRPAIAAFLINNLAIAAMLWITAGHYAVAPRTWIPFQANKLSMLTVAVLAPTTWVGAITIGLYSVSAFLGFAALDAAARGRLPVGEPWALIAYLLFACVILLYRARQQRIEERMVCAESEAANLAHMARVFLAVRDLANTPLQTIAATTAMLEEIPAARVHAQRLRRSLDRMKEWEQILGEESRHLRWAETDTAFDPLLVLKKR